MLYLNVIPHNFIRENNVTLDFEASTLKPETWLHEDEATSYRWHPYDKRMTRETYQSREILYSTPLSVVLQLLLAADLRCREFD